MLLTERQRDGLTELINIAFGRAAAALSELANQRVLVKVPQVAVYPIDDMGRQLGSLIQGEVATVHQIFSGPVAGDAFLLVDYQGAGLLCDLMTGEPPRPRRLVMSDREVLVEVGNILLNACLGTFGDMLRVHISFAVPSMQVEALGELANSLVIEQKELRYALVIYTDFRLRDSAVGGYLVIVLGVDSLDRLVQAVEEL